jgi:predicted AlkP superfamily pyrophosphatase or phosphodiesterase
MQALLLINAVGLSLEQIGPHTPQLEALARRGAAAPLGAVFPAVTLSAQASLLTGTLPREHGVVGNGWFVGEMGEPLLWRQPNGICKGEKLYEAAARQLTGFTSAKLFWWFNLGARVDRSLTPRPYYPADGRKIPAVYGWPKPFPLELEAQLGPFPFFDFWGPKAGLASSRWLAEAAQLTLTKHRPTLTMVYLPHLDYDHQRFGPGSAEGRRALLELDQLVGQLVAAADQIGAETVVVSEYALTAVRRQVHINRALRQAGLLEVRATPSGEVLDVFGSRAFALADHQHAHVYVPRAEDLSATRAALKDLPGIEALLDRREQAGLAIDHPRSGDLVALAETDAWFTYYFWLDDSQAPDFAPTVDIHRKPGYDPAELFVDPALKAPKLRVARRLLQKKLGFRYLMDVIPLHGDQVRGSHGRLPARPEQGPVFLSSAPWSRLGGEPSQGLVPMTAVKERLLGLLSGPAR